MLYVTVTAKFSLGYRLSFLLFICSLSYLCFHQPKKTIFPAFFLVFMMPIWGGLVPILQGISTAVVSVLMSLTSIPIYVEGNVISIPNGVFEIAGGCSGLRYFLVSSAISSLYIYLYLKRAKSAAIFAFTALFGALVVNWIRILALILIGYFTNMESSLMQDHNNFGWFLYLPFMFGLFQLGNFLSKREAQENTPTNQVKTVRKDKPKPLAVLAFSLVIGLVVSDTSREYFFSNSAPSNCAVNQKAHQILTPELQHVSQTCDITLDDLDLRIYYFDPLNLDSKPEFYLNSLFDNYKIVDESFTTKKQWKKLIVKKGKKFHFVAFSYNSGDKYTGLKSTHKKNKLISAAFGISQESFITYQAICATNCTDEVDKFIPEITHKL